MSRFPTSQLVTVVTDNPMYKYVEKVTKTTPNDIDRLYSKTEYLEIPVSLKDNADMVDAWLAQILLYGLKVKDDEIKNIPQLTRIMEIKNVPPATVPASDKKK